MRDYTGQQFLMTGTFTYLDNGCDEYQINWTMLESKLVIRYDVYTTDSMGNTDHFLSMDVKWDGCCNLRFPSFEECMFHACTRAQLHILTTIPQQCYDHAAKTIPIEE